MYANKIVFCIIAALLQASTHVNAATTFTPVSGTITSFGEDVVVAATIDLIKAGDITVTYELTTAVPLGVVTIASNAGNLVPQTGLDANKYAISIASAVLTVTIKAIAATDDGIGIKFDHDTGEDATYTIDTKTGFSPLVQFVAFGDDLTFIATIPVDQTQSIAVAHGLTTAVSFGTIAVVHDAGTAAGKVVLTAATTLDATKYSIAETTDTTVTIIIKSIATTDDGTDITFTSGVASNAQDATYTINAKTSFIPLSGTVGTLGMDFVITATMSVIASHTTSISLHDGNNKTHIAWFTVDHTAATSALKLVVDADAALDATKFAIVKASDTTVTLTFKKYATTDFNKVFVFDSTVNNQDAVFVIGGGSFECDRIPPFGIEIEMTSSGCNQTTYQTKGCQVVFKCTDGYYGQSVVSTCNDAYQWTNGQPTCMRQCDAHPFNVNVLLSSGTGCSNTLYNLAKCESLFGCSDGLMGDKTMRTCKEDGIWTGEFPTCKN